MYFYSKGVRFPDQLSGLVNELKELCEEMVIILLEYNIIYAILYTI